MNDTLEKEVGTQFKFVEFGDKLPVPNHLDSTFRGLTEATSRRYKGEKVLCASVYFLNENGQLMSKDEPLDDILSANQGQPLRFEVKVPRTNQPKPEPGWVYLRSFIDEDGERCVKVYKPNSDDPNKTLSKIISMKDLLDANFPPNR